MAYLLLFPIAIICMFLRIIYVNYKRNDSVYFVEKEPIFDKEDGFYDDNLE